MAGHIAPKIAPRTSPIQHKIVRTRGCIADITISADSIIRNEIELRYERRTGSWVPFFPYDPNIYDLTDDLCNKMPMAYKENFLSQKWVELVVDEASIEAPEDTSRSCANLAPTVISQLRKLGPEFAKQVHKLVIRLILPAASTTSVSYPQEPTRYSNYKSTISRTYPFLSQLVRELEGFTSIKIMNVVVQVPSNFDEKTPLDAVLPFYELSTFVDWGLKVLEPGKSSYVAVPWKAVRSLNTKFDKLCKDDKKALEDFVFVHPSQHYPQA
ncbi:hypothetical protein EG329_005456 [Mollisiaceae sp. DMI_Dod_QoI]|nr:hypothetical protein EG329_005456 [Helotiales sp. DMI_Dod_QoI]